MEHTRRTIDCEPAIPRYVAAYLREAGDECMFVEAYTSRATPILLRALADAGRRPEEVRWIAVTHAHLDHAGGAGTLLAACPRATLLAHPRAARNLIDPTKLVKSATAVYGEERFRELYGTIEPIPAERVRVLEDGDTVELGDATLRAFHTAGHAKHHLVLHDPATGAVFTGDTFGLVYPAWQGGGRLAFPSTSPTDFDPVEARRSVAKVLSLGAERACLTHFVEVEDLAEVGRQLGAWLDRAEAWLDEADRLAAPPAEAEARLASLWRDALEAELSARGVALDATARQVLALDVELNAQGVAFSAARRRESREKAAAEGGA